MSLYQDPNQSLTLNPEEVETNCLQFEYIILGQIMLQNDVIDSLGFLKPEHFHSRVHMEIYEAMLDLRSLPEVINPITVAPMVTVVGGGLRYLNKAMMAGVYSSNPMDVAKTIIDYSNRRDIEQFLRNQIVELQGGLKSSSEILTTINSKIMQMSTNSHLAKFSTGKQVGMRILEKLNKQVQPYSTGIPKLDRAMDGGIFPSMCYLFGGRKKMGKTTLASTVSCNMNQNGVPHLYIAAEMSDEEIEQRNLARLTGSYASSFRNDYGRGEEFKTKLQEAINQNPNNIIYLQAPGISFDELKTAVAQAVLRFGIKGFILDCLQLVGGKPNRKSTAEHLDDVAQWCATYPREKNLFSIVTAQINQTGNIRGGEGIRMACDQGYEIHAPEGDPSRSDRWLEMIETRYTSWMDVGSKTDTALLMSDNGPFLYQRDIAEQQPLPL